MSDLENVLKFLLETTQPDAVRGTIFVAGVPLASLEIYGLNNGEPGFQMRTRCGRCGLELTRDELDARTFAGAQDELLKRQQAAAAAHWQGDHA